jgi:hypothetical protein
MDRSTIWMDYLFCHLGVSCGSWRYLLDDRASGADARWLTQSRRFLRPVATYRAHFSHGNFCFSYSGRAEWSDYGQLTDDNAPGLMLNRHIK